MVQLPVAPAYALVLHKVQALTMAGKVLGCLEGIFAHGQVYVLVSRVTDPWNLCLIGLPPADLLDEVAAAWAAAGVRCRRTWQRTDVPLTQARRSRACTASRQTPLARCFQRPTLDASRQFHFGGLTCARDPRWALRRPCSPSSAPCCPQLRWRSQVPSARSPWAAPHA